MASNLVTVHIRGKEFRVRTPGDEASLQRVAGYLDETMAKVEERTGTVDSAIATGRRAARQVVRALRT